MHRFTKQVRRLSRNNKLKNRSSGKKLKKDNLLSSHPLSPLQLKLYNLFLITKLPKINNFSLISSIIPLSLSIPNKILLMIYCNKIIIKILRKILNLAQSKQPRLLKIYLILTLYTRYNSP